MKTFIGFNRNKDEVYIDKPFNSHVLALGASGTGKSSKLNNLFFQGVDSGRQSVYLNWHGCDSISPLSSDLEERYTLINAAESGIPISLFTSLIGSEGKKEQAEILIGRIVSLLSKSVNLTHAQNNSLNSAVRTVLENNSYSSNGIRAVYDELISQGTSTAHITVEKLTPFFETNLIRDGFIFDDTHTAVELNLNGLDYEHQLVIVNFLLDYFLRVAQKGVFIDKGLTIFLDEVQNLSFNSISPINMLINESRKHNVQLLMAAPSLTAGNKRGMDIATQCGTCLFFKPLIKDQEKTARMIDEANKKLWSKRLSLLKRGEFIATSSFMIGDRIFNQPIKLSTYIGNDI